MSDHRPIRGAYLPALGVEIPLAAPLAIEWLIGLAPTEHYAERIAALEQQGVISNRSLERRRQLDLRRYRALHERCGQRDALLAMRPRGCWCLGHGQRPSTNGERPKDTVSYGMAAYIAFCGCADGVDAARIATVMKARSQGLLENKRVDTYWSSAGVGQGYAHHDLVTLEVDEVDQPHLDLLREWVSEANYSNICLYSSHGQGKTTLAVGLLKAALRKGRRGLFVDGNILLQELIADERSAEPSRMLQSLMDLEILVIDDLGRRRPTAYATDEMFTLINARSMRRLPTIVTTNYSPYSDPKRDPGMPRLATQLGEATVQRLMDRTSILKLQGQNRRFDA